MARDDVGDEVDWPSPLRQPYAVELAAARKGVAGGVALSVSRRGTDASSFLLFIFLFFSQLSTIGFLISRPSLRAHRSR
jgi:hypothetical protein